MAHKTKKSHTFAFKLKPKLRSSTTKKVHVVPQSVSVPDHATKSDDEGSCEGSIVVKASVSETDNVTRQQEHTPTNQKVEHDEPTSGQTYITYPNLKLCSISRPQSFSKPSNTSNYLGDSSNSAAKASGIEYEVSDTLGHGDILYGMDKTSVIEDVSTVQVPITATQDMLVFKGYPVTENDNHLSSGLKNGIARGNASSPDCVKQLADTPISPTLSKSDTKPKRHYTSYAPKRSWRRSAIDPFKSLGPSLMFTSLFGTGPLSQYRTVPIDPPQDVPSRIAQTSQPEKVVKQAVEEDSDPSPDSVGIPLAVQMTLSQAEVIDPLLDGVTFCKNRNDSPVWFEREPISDIDPDFSDDEDDYMRTREALISVSAPSSLPIVDYGGMDPNLCLILEETSTSEEETSISDEFSEPDGYSSGITVTSRDSSESSGMSASSTDFVMDNTFLGSTSARDIIDYAMPNSSGNITKKALAAAFIRCVSDEHADRRSESPGIDAPGVTFITEDDVDRCMSFETQRRAKLGHISLFKFLKTITFDHQATASEKDIIEAWCKAALESRELTEKRKNSPASHAVRRISQSDSGSGQPRGRTRMRSSS
ncbi:hypothetical protein GMOD_00008307 [Pyrenophora seminiperda CCB06]|uniref:Uncharacterized protein n=1 Tax=Pyrenophora seminiperda CCB06 TaxID=1302712 RepID=A0A3M7M260_9PLEO|nr:hypothetical protein GMOD_00008307 [Pyrenophora seminiperda CCB06]